MLLFDLFPKKAEYKEQKLSLNPKFIVSVIETEQRPDVGFFQPVAIITMDSGDQFTVFDYDRTVAKRIRQEFNALEILQDLYQAEPCRFDHHGYCQAHDWFATYPKCPHARIRDLGITKET